MGDDEWRLVYHETTTDQTTIAYGKIKFIVRGNEFKRFTNINAPGNSVIEAYKLTKGKTPAASGTGWGMKIDNFNANKYVSVCKGSLIAPKSGNYTFYASPDERALFYFSKRPLAGDPDIDRKYLTLIDNTNYHGYDKQYPSDWHMLKEGERYYFCFVIYNTDGVGGGKIGYIVNSTGEIVDFPGDKVFFDNVDGVLAQKYNEGWMPESFEEIKGVDNYYSQLTYKAVVKSVTAPIEQENRPWTNLIDGVKGNDNNIYVTRWNTQKGDPVIAEYPQEFQFDLQTMSTFDIIWLRRCKEARRVITSNLTVKCDNKLVYSGAYDSHGEGMSLFTRSSNNWTQKRAGGYYNGFGMYGSEGATLEFKLKAGVTQFVIIGDRWVSELGSNIASVTINGRHSGNIMADMTSSSSAYPKLYKKPLYVMRHMNTAEDVTVKVQVESGEVGIAGILLKEDEMKDALIPLSAESNDNATSGQEEGEGSSVSSPSVQNDSVGFGSQVVIAAVFLCVVALTIIGAVLLRRKIGDRGQADSLNSRK